MKVLTAKLHKVSHNCVSAVSLAIFAGFRTQLIKNGGFLLRREKVRDLTTVQKVVDIFKERLLHDLCVGEKEDLRLTLDTRFHQELLDIFVELLLSVVLGDFN